MLKTKIVIEYDGFISRSDLGKLLMMAASFDSFHYMEVKEPGKKAIYSCTKEKIDELI